jgi:chemotaxis protein histidine kinase CheA
VSLLNGTFDIESAPKKGTTVYVRVPVEYRIDAPTGSVTA